MTEPKPEKKTKIYVCNCPHGWQGCKCNGTGYVGNVSCSGLV